MKLATINHNNLLQKNPGAMAGALASCAAGVVGI